jgi:carboxymethylenebutenolidase
LLDRRTGDSLGDPVALRGSVPADGHRSDRGAGMDEALTAREVTFTGHGGDQVTAYVARPEGAPSRGGVVVVHHMPGWDSATKEITRRFAANGFDAVCPNLHERDAPGADPDDAAAASRAAGGVPDERLVGDVAGAAAYLRALRGGTGKVGVIGYCSGGRQAFLAACSLDLDAAVDCYGAFVTGQPPADFPIEVTPIGHLAPALSCPLLGLFGNEDSRPSPSDVDELERLLVEAGKTYELHRYDGAGHAFFAVDRPAYRPAAATDGWRRVLTWFERYLAA